MTDGGRRSTRDVRIDVVRGIALLVIFVDHLESLQGTRIFLHVTLIQFGLSDAFEAFVFISGFVFGLAYRPALEDGLLTAQRKSLRRCLQLTVANSCAFLTVWILVELLQPSRTVVHQLSLGPLVEDPLTATFNVLLCRYQPYCFDILPLYIAVLVLAPLQLWLYRESAWFGSWVALNLYFLGQFAVDLNDLGWRYNPFCWQLLFFTGMAMSQSGSKFDRLQWPVAVSTAIAFILLTWFAGFASFAHDIPYADHLLSQTDAGIVRMLHFFLLAVPVAWSLQQFQWLSENAVSHRLSLCGQHSLFVFLTGVVLTYLGHMILPPGSDSWLFGYECLSLGVLVMIPGLFTRRRLVD